MKGIIVAAILCALGGCAPPPETVCTKRETYTKTVPSIASPGMAGIKIGPVRHVILSRCVEREPNPAYQEWRESRG